jgi:two-component system, cell cycle response regulator
MRVLLVGDDGDDALVLRRALAESGGDAYRLEHAPALARALERIRSDRPDVIFLELGPDNDRLGPLVQVRKRAPDVPIVVLVRPGEDDVATLALKEGAHDYLIPARADGELVLRSIRYAMERAHLVRELAEAREQLNGVSLRDELTGLYNRRGFNVLAEQQMRLARRWDSGLLVLVLDVDGLDAVNEKFGRRAGDDLLVEAGQLLRESFRDSDVKARTGGDEFAVLLTGAAEGTAEVIDARLTQNLARLNGLQGRRSDLSLSGGLAKWSPTSGQGIAELLEHAEHLMHEQKRGLPGNVTLAEA